MAEHMNGRALEPRPSARGADDYRAAAGLARWSPATLDTSGLLQPEPPVKPQRAKAVKGDRRERRIDWQSVGRALGSAAAALVIGALALGLAVYSAAASYESVSRLATHLGIPLSSLTPLGIDGGLFGVITFDIVLTLTGRPIWWLRWTGRLFAAGVIAANAAAGWPDPVSVGLRCGAPVLFVVIVEAARTVMLGRAGHISRDRIPRARWLLDFRGTLALWRRMRLWDERSYACAVDMELSRRQAIMNLTAHYGAVAWRLDAPSDLVWMLDSGVRLPEALRRVAELLDVAKAQVAATAAVVSERAALQAEFETLREAAQAAEAARDEAGRQAASEKERADVLARKLAAAAAAKRKDKVPPKKPEASSRIIPPEERERMVRELFDANPSISIKDAAAGLGWSRDTVSPILKALQDEANIRPMERRA